jgi:hypothetical protein
MQKMIKKTAGNNFKITLNSKNMTGVTHFYGIEHFFGKHTTERQ